MPPKFYNKGRSTTAFHLGNYSNTNHGSKSSPAKVSVTFLLIGTNRVGIEVPYKAINNDEYLRNLIKVRESQRRAIKGFGIDSSVCGRSVTKIIKICSMPC